MKYKYNGQWVEVTLKALEGMPIGSIIQFVGTVIPTGWLECNGSTITQSEYPELYNLIGGTLPDFRGKVLVGQDTNDTDFNALLETGGSKYLQQHEHIKNIGLYKYEYSSGFDGQVYKGDGPLQYMDVGSGNVSNNTQTGNSGNLQPYAVVKHIIKATQTTPTFASVVNATNSSTTDGYSCDYVNDKLSDVDSSITSLTSSLSNKEDKFIRGTTLNLTRNVSYFIVVKPFTTVVDACAVGVVLGGFDVKWIYSNGVTVSKSDNTYSFSSTYGGCSAVAISF